MTDLTAIIAERDDAIRRANANHHACEAMRRQLQEAGDKLAQAEESLRIERKDKERIAKERDSWKATAMIEAAKFGAES